MPNQSNNEYTDPKQKKFNVGKFVSDTAIFGAGGAALMAAGVLTVPLLLILLFVFAARQRKNITNGINNLLSKRQMKKDLLMQKLNKELQEEMMANKLGPYTPNPAYLNSNSNAYSQVQTPTNFQPLPMPYQQTQIPTSINQQKPNNQNNQSSNNAHKNKINLHQLEKEKLIESNISSSTISSKTNNTNKARMTTSNLFTSQSSTVQPIKFNK